MRRYISLIITSIVVLTMFVSCRRVYDEPEGETNQSTLPDISNDDLQSTPEAPESNGPVIIENVTEKPEKTFEITVELLYEAEDATLRNLEIYTKDIANVVSEISANGCVGLWNLKESRLTFNVEVPESGTYELGFMTASFNGESYNTVKVNGRTFYEGLYTNSQGFEQSSVKAELDEGPNAISVEMGWGWIYLDCLHVTSAQGINNEVYDVEKSLVNKKASDNAQRLMSYLVDQYGENTLAGQYASDLGIDSPEVQAIYKLTGKYPAIMGFDLMDYSPSRVEYGAETKQTEYALQWGEMGGIVTLIWHWNAPKDLTNTSKLPWWKGFYTEATTFDLDKALSGQDDEGYDLILRDIDVIAEQLRILADEDIPVLWRPLHEASGGWFWWGACGAENYIKLWKLMYERLTYTHNLNNLIWIFNGQDADWYPGDEFVDIIAEDVYTVPYDYESHYNRFEKALGYTDTLKITGLAENGVIPDPDLMYEDNSRWSFFITWSDLFVIEKKSKEISDEYNSLEHFIKVYNHDRIITLDELPDLDNYSLN